MSRCYPLCLVMLSMLGLTGCHLGPTVLRSEHASYAQAIQQTTMQQLLHNLVRMRYGETPVFLQVTSISAQYVLEGVAEGTTTIDTGGGSDFIGAGAGLSYSERPTITFSQLKGKEFVTQLMTPINLDEMGLLTQSGWRSDALMRVAVESLNGLDNARRASGPMPTFAPEFETFYESCQLMHDLKKKRLIEFEYTLHSEEISDPLPAAAVTGAAAVSAASSDIRFRKVDDGPGYVLTRERPVVILRLLAEPGASEELDQLRVLLNLAPDQATFEFVDSDKNPINLRDESRRYTTLAFAFRSVYSMMFYLSHAVRVPEHHAANCVVASTYGDEGQVFDWGEMLADILQVHVSNSYPKNAFIAIQHRDHWFYIRDNDVQSKSTIMLVATIFSLRAGNLPDREPVLTLPVTG